MIEPPLRVEPLGQHDRAAFSCGNPELDRYIREVAGQDQRADLSRCFVLVHPDQPRDILAYYTLSNASIARESGPEASRKVRRYPQIAAILLGRLAIARAHQGRGLGRGLMLHILTQIAAISLETGIELVLVDPIDPAAAAFYARFDFAPLPGQSRMYLSLKDLRAELGL